MWCSHDAGRCAGTKTGTFQLTANCAVSFTTLASTSDAHASISNVASSRRLAHPSLCHPAPLSVVVGAVTVHPRARHSSEKNAIVFVSAQRKRLGANSDDVTVWEHTVVHWLKTWLEKHILATEAFRVNSDASSRW